MELDAIVLVKTIYCLMFLACAITDIIWLRIPNSIVLAIFLVFVICAIGFDVKSPLLKHVLPAFVIFTIAALLFHFDKFGGGDVKLLTTATLWVGIDALPHFLIFLGIAGFILVILFRTARTPAAILLTRLQQLGGISFPMPKALLTESHVPYGVVIAASAILSINRISFL